MTGIVLGVGYSGGQQGSSCSHGPPKNSLRDISKMVSYLGSCITGQSRSHENFHMHFSGQRKQGWLSARSPDNAASWKCDFRTVGSRCCNLFNLNSSFVLKSGEGAIKYLAELL